jgi:ATP-dependent DNA helicase RecG
MSELGMLDTMGFGIHDMIARQIDRYLPLPQYDLSSPDKVAVTIFGGMIDPAFSTMLMLKPDLPVREVIALDRVQKKLPVDAEALRKLRNKGLVEGLVPSVYITPLAADSTEMRPKQLDAGQDDETLRSIILEVLHAHDGATRQQINEALDDHLDQALSAEQRSMKVSNLLTQMRKQGLVRNTGTRTKPEWRAAESPE